MKIAVVHDSFAQFGGADRVTDEICRLVPSAVLFSTIAIRERMPERLRSVEVRTTWMQRLPNVRKLFRLYFFLYPLAVRSMKLDDFDLVVSSTWAFAKGVKIKRGSLHICYCHNPTRWVWEYDQYVLREQLWPGVKWILPYFIWVLKRWDISAARRPHYFITNSQYSAERILAAYGRTCAIIHPPVEVERFAIAKHIGDYYLILARLVTYRRIDTAVVACTRLGRRLCVIGIGPDLPNLQAIAGPEVEFLGALANAEVNEYVSRCRALLFPGVEDFGIVALEAAAAGRPTIAFRGGGAVETIVEGTTGVFYEHQTADDLVEAILLAERMSWNPVAIREHALKFSPQVFRERFSDLLDELGVQLPREVPIEKVTDDSVLGASSIVNNVSKGLDRNFGIERISD